MRSMERLFLSPVLKDKIGLSTSMSKSSRRMIQSLKLTATLSLRDWTFTNIDGSAGPPENSLPRMSSAQRLTTFCTSNTVAMSTLKSILLNSVRQTN